MAFTKKQKNNAKKIFLLSGAKWITHPVNKENILYFEKTFVIEKKTSATIFICGLGFFTAYINGKKVGNSFFEPIMTDYEKRDKNKNPDLLIGQKQKVFGSIYDVKEYLKEGENILSVMVGNGYYCNEDRPEEPNVSYGRKKLIFQLIISDKNHEQIIISDETVQVKYLSAISTLYEGDRINFLKKSESFVHCLCAAPVEGDLYSQTDISDVIEKELTPVAVVKKEKSTIFDFGINHSGYIALFIRGEVGEKVIIKFAEKLYKTGELNMETSRWEAFNDQTKKTHRIDQIGEYVLSGEMDEIKPLFCWHCYRYVEVCSNSSLEILNMRSLYIHMNVKKIGHFLCDISLLNEMAEKAERTILNNLHAGLLSDCPHREKRPYTGDGQLVAESMMYDLDCVKFYDKWLDDIINAQTDDGFIPYTAPYLGGGGGYAWGNAIAVVPDLLYRFTGEKNYIKKAYLPIKNWLDYYKRHFQNGQVIASEQNWCLGEWLTPDMTDFNIPFMSTLCYYKAVEIEENIAKWLGKKEATEFGKLKKQIAECINKEFFDEKKVCYCNGIQGENVIPLAYGIVPEKYQEKLREKVWTHYVKTKEYHIDTGIIMTPILLDYLTKNGMESIAIKLIMQKTYPSYAYMLKGETTFSEHWSKKWPDYRYNNSNRIIKGGKPLSHCHCMFGSVLAWLYKYVAGIDESEAYLGKIKYAPKFIEQLNFAEAETMTRFGKASIRWKKDPFVHISIEVPEGAIGIFEYNRTAEFTATDNLGYVRKFSMKEKIKNQVEFSPGVWILEENKMKENKESGKNEK